MVTQKIARRLGWGIGAIALPISLAPAVLAQTMEPLPPPPTVTVPDINTTMPQPYPTNAASPPVGMPAQSPQMPPDQVFQAPNMPQQPMNQGQQYLVFVNSGSSFLLQQVQQVEPSASFQMLGGQSVIQVGTFPDEMSARQKAELLRMRGINAEVTAMSPPASYPAPTAVAPSMGYPAAPGGMMSPNSPYYVVVPGNPEQLFQLTNKAIQMGIRPETIQQRMQPLGPHVAIGPFPSYPEAKDVTNYLKRGGMNARVYFQQ